MYLFKNAKDSLINSLQYDKSSPLIKLNYLFKVILRFTFLVSFSFLAIIVSTLYVENNIINKKLLQSFEITSLILSLLSFIILIRQNGTYILSKIKMYPFSFKDLIDVSLSTGVVTISVLDIFLVCYEIFIKMRTNSFNFYKKKKKNIYLFLPSFIFLTSTRSFSFLSYTLKCAYKAVDEYVQSNMTIGLGTGSTVFYVLERIDNLLKSGKLKDVVCIPTSIDTELKARKLGIPLTTLEKHSNIDITIDGTDEIDLNLNLIKGRGGALVREKLVASSSSLFII
ncbi:ribose 5-phosphate isomerase A, partial [Plasmodium falciparum Palo Alto/Uganda]